MIPPDERICMAGDVQHIFEERLESTFEADCKSEPIVAHVDCGPKSAIARTLASCHELKTGNLPIHHIESTEKVSLLRSHSRLAFGAA